MSPIPEQRTPVPVSTTPLPEDHELQSFWAYLEAECTPSDKHPTTDFIWKQTEREKVYNFLLYVPYQVERMMWFGSTLCFDSFLATLTILPVRCCIALLRLVLPRKGASTRLHGSQLFDLLALLVLLLAASSVRMVKPGLIYYWMKDITWEFLKIPVLFSALEIFDKILSNFGIDVLEALSGTCTLYLRGRASLPQLLLDSFVLYWVVLLHAVVLMCQALVFSVAMNSKKNALLALLIAANFVEIKGTVYKRMDPSKLWSLASMDIVERFHLLVAMVFVGLEDMDSSAAWLPAAATVVECCRILASETLIDIIKHAVLSKFNDIRPGIFREYMRDLCEDASGAQSHNLHKLVGFFPLGPAALSLRMAATLFYLNADAGWRWQSRAQVFGAVWCGLLLVKPLLGYGLKLLSAQYVSHYRLRHQGAGRPTARVIHRSKAESMAAKSLIGGRPKAE